jgi:hypothetical protein
MSIRNFIDIINENMPIQFATDECINFINNAIYNAEKATGIRFSKIRERNKNSYEIEGVTNY